MTRDHTTKHFGGATATHDKSKYRQFEQFIARLCPPPSPLGPNDILRQQRCIGRQPECEGMRERAAEGLMLCEGGNG